MFVIKSNPNEGVWFDLDGSDAKVCLRICSQSALKEIRKAGITKHRRFQDGLVYEWDETDDDMMSNMTFDYCIVDWTGIADENGGAIPCTKENKIWAMNNDNRFARLVTKFLNQLNAAEEGKSESEAKNS